MFIAQKVSSLHMLIKGEFEQFCSMEIKWNILQLATVSQFHAMHLENLFTFFSKPKIPYNAIF